MNSHARRQSTPALGAAFALITTMHLACAQPLQPEVLASFNGTNGSSPNGLTLGRDGNFYGTSVSGGSEGVGTVFQVTTSGALTTLYSFGSTTNSFGGPADGAQPEASLTLGSDGNFCGTTSLGGSNYNPLDDFWWRDWTHSFDLSCGTVFRVTTEGTLTTLYSFGTITDAFWGTPLDGSYPLSSLTAGGDGNLYGTARNGGFFDMNALTTFGTLFRVTTNGQVTVLAVFDGDGCTGIGSNPRAGLTLGGDGNLFGTTTGGFFCGDAGTIYREGTVFRATTNGYLTTLAGFDGPNGANPGNLTLGNDGALYGTTMYGGPHYSPGNGTLFRATTSGLLTTLASFTGTNGANPQAGLTLGSDGNFYGTTVYGSNGWNGTNSSGYGTVFQVTTNGVLTTLVSFTGANGANPQAALTLGNDGNFYGTASSGGSGGGGVIFRLRHGVSIQSFGISTNGFQLNTLNVGGSGWVVLESSSDLLHWTPIQTNGTAAPQQFLDPGALVQPLHFYRVRQQ